MLVITYLGVNKQSYAFNKDANTMGDYILNPDWVEYMDLSEEEKATYEVIPEQFIYRYKKLGSPLISFFNLSGGYPEYYNLNDGIF